MTDEIRFDKAQLRAFRSALRDALGDGRAVLETREDEGRTRHFLWSYGRGVARREAVACESGPGVGRRAVDVAAALKACTTKTPHLALPGAAALPLPRVDRGASFAQATTTCADLDAALKTVKPFVGRDPARASLRLLEVRLTGTDMRLRATDGHAQCDVRLGAVVAQPGFARVALPGEAVAALGVGGRAADPVFVRLCERGLLIIYPGGHLRLFARAAEGALPEPDVSGEADASFRVDAGLLARALGGCGGVVSVEIAAGIMRVVAADRAIAVGVVEEDPS